MYCFTGCYYSSNDQGEGSVTAESARIMLKRGIRPVEGGVSFSRDLRHRGYSLYGLVDGMCEEFARNIQCPHLLIKVLYRDGNETSRKLKFHNRGALTHGK